MLFRSHRVTTTAAPLHHVSTTAPRLYGDDAGIHRFRQPFYDTDFQQQPRSTVPQNSDPANTLALAISRLAVANESVTLPKSEIIKFDGSARNFQRFLNSFDHNIGNLYSFEVFFYLTLAALSLAFLDFL